MLWFSITNHRHRKLDYRKSWLVEKLQSSWKMDALGGGGWPLGESHCSSKGNMS